MASPVLACMPSMRRVISSAFLALWFARSFISFATTVNPLPASPAEDASMVALRASKFVFSDILFITSVTAPISFAASPSLFIVAVASPDLTVASLAILRVS